MAGLSKSEIDARVKRMFCKECGKNFVHYVAGMPQEICGVCAGLDDGRGDE